METWEWINVAAPETGDGEPGLKHQMEPGFFPKN